MSAQEVAGLITAVAALLGAMGAIYAQLRQTHALVNSRMTELLALTKTASRTEGQLAEKHEQELAGQAVVHVQGQLVQGEPGRPAADDAPTLGT